MRETESVFNEVARNHNISAEEVRTEILLAIKAAMSNPDPDIQAKWAGIPKAGKEITPEELVAYIVKEITQLSQETL